MARGGSRAQSERLLRSLGGGSDEIAQYRAYQRASSDYSKIGTQLERLGREANKSIKASALGVKEEISAFNKGMADRLKALVDSKPANIVGELRKLTLESEQKLAEMRAKTGILGELPMSYPRQASEFFHRYYDDTNVQMGYVGNQQVMFVGNQLQKNDEFTFKDVDGNKVKVTDLGPGRPIKELGDQFDANMDLGVKVYVLPEEYFERGKA